MYYYIMQVVRGVTHAYGPYRTEVGRNNALGRVHGGEVYPYDTFEEDSVKAIDEFKVRRLG